MVAFLDYLPRGSTLSDQEFNVRHTFLQWVLLLHLPALLIFGLVRNYSVSEGVEAIAAPVAFLLLSRVLRSRRLAGLAVTAGLSSCSASLVVLSGGAIEAHFHFFITIGLIALYQDWVPFAWNALFTVVSHGAGSLLLPEAFFAHYAGQHHPWTWGLIHGLAVLAACAGVMLLLRFNENDHRRTVAMRAELAESNRKRFTADLLVNLARRNQSLIYRQLELLNGLEEHERDAEQLSHLFQLDHLATRIRRNAESLLVLSGEEPARTWGGSVLLVDVVRAAIAEIEELDRVDFSVEDSLKVSGRAVADATHLLAELIENAVHFSPPGLSVMIRTRPYLPSPGAQVLTIEDWGLGMSAGEIADANDLLRLPREVDLATSRQLGLHVVARLAARYGIECSLNPTPGGGVTAVVVWPAELFATVEQVSRTPVGAGVGGRQSFGADPDAAPVDLELPGASAASVPGASVPGASVPAASVPAASVPFPESLLDTSLGFDLDTGLDVELGSGVGYFSRDGLAPDSPLPASAVPDGPGSNGPAPDGTGSDSAVPGGAASAGPLPAGPLPDSTLAASPLAASPLPDSAGSDSAGSDSAGSDSAGSNSAGSDSAGSDSAAADGGLARRTPQANLADELRRAERPEPGRRDRRDRPKRADRSRRDSTQARSALSRFQAAQRAAREADRRDTDIDGEARL